MTNSSSLTGKTAIVISGGSSSSDVGKNVELIGNFDAKLPSLPEVNDCHSMVMNNNNELMTLGGEYGDKKQCYKLVNGSWQKQNPLTQPRQNAVG